MTAGRMMAMTASARLIATTAQIVITIPRLIIALMNLVDVFQIFMVFPFPIELDGIRVKAVQENARGGWRRLSCSLNRFSRQCARSIFRHRSAVNSYTVNYGIDACPHLRIQSDMRWQLSLVQPLGFPRPELF